MRPQRWRAIRGQALVEFALVFPILILMIFGIVDAGRLIYTYNTVANAARDGARVAIVNQSASTTGTCDTASTIASAIGCAIESGLALGLTETDISVSYMDPTDTSTCTSLTIGCLAEVSVTGHFQPLTPIVGNIIGPVDLKSTAKIPIERVCSSSC